MDKAVGNGLAASVSSLDLICGPSETFLEIYCLHHNKVLSLGSDFYGNWIHYTSTVCL